ncbi:glycosyltransferase family 2 protein [Granulibacter bethesdensis]|uniref:Cytosolic protein n=1 Tax=Granulibacter bethesdensis (strain ATCC BAA-1260 / CGDNIH1) TaxID=391165 RepID=Q0BW44_GRABC|nr:glycosyltransferase family 2 protein [Granulibacter bethesdensis]ABI60958.1 putative cytosolic protein [Granulibacter bethesdensis CGDNIH1]APH50725.1 putative cytosolic protein [Granulibacter bethesdensis]APH63420.1 putative cytosolic protein [Granulibacter bethesdensis]
MARKRAIFFVFTPHQCCEKFLISNFIPTCEVSLSISVNTGVIRAVVVFYRLRSAHGTIVCASTSNGQLSHLPVDKIAGSEHEPVYIARFAHAPLYGFAFRLSGPISLSFIGNQAEQSSLVGIKIYQADTGKFTLFSFPGYYFSSVLGGKQNACAAARGGWEIYTLEQTADIQPPDDVVQCLAHLETILSKPLSVERLIQSIEPADASDTALVRTVFQALFFLLPYDDIDRLSGRIAGDLDLLNAVRAIFPDDFWLQTALPDLKKWQIDQRLLPETLSIGPDRDYLQRTGQNSHPTSVGFFCNFSARSQIEPRKNACVVTTARNEGVYILEWIAHYQALGFEHIFFYSNNNDDGSEQLLKVLAKEGIITYIDNVLGAGGSAQSKAFGHALSQAPYVLDFRWALLCDLDEFLVLDRKCFSGMQDYLEWQEAFPTDLIAINWVEFGPNGQSRWNNRPLMERFQKRPAEALPAVKSLVKPHRFFHSQPHFPVVERNRTIWRRDAGGNKLPYIPSDEATAANANLHERYASLNHYWHKSVEEFLWKASRNRGNRPMTTEQTTQNVNPEVAQRYLTLYKSNNQKDADYTGYFVDKIYQNKEKLLNIPSIRQINNNIEDLFKENIYKTVQFFKNDASFIENPVCRALLELLK